MENDISSNVIPSEGQVTLSIVEYHKLLASASKLDLTLSEKDKEFQLKLEEKDKEVIEEQKKFIKLQEKSKKALKIISDNISKFNINGEKDVRRAGMLQESIVEGLDVIIDEFNEENNI